MMLFYDPDSDTLQTRTRRYARDRNLIPVVVPTWDEVDDDAVCMFCAEPTDLCQHWNAASVMYA